MQNIPERDKERFKKFTGLREEAAAKRVALKQQQLELQQLQLKRATLAKELSSLGGTPADLAERRKKAAQLNEVSSAIDTMNKRLIDVRGSIGDLIDQIIVFTDPREQVAHMDDHFPVFLMPVRVETRFVVVKHIARVPRNRFPDRREEVFSSSVAGIFSSITRIPVVEDLNELWIRIFPDDIAVHTLEEALTELEQEAGRIFWTNMWYAGKDAGLEAGAWRGLIAGRSAERAAWIARQVKPVNADAAPVSPVPASSPLPTLPTFPTVAGKAKSWSSMPHSRVMPERFVVRLYTGESFREVVGKRVPDELPVSLDPEDEAASIDNADGKLVLPANLKWIQDFDEAEKIGMAIRVPLSVFEKSTGFDRLVVLGLKVSADPSEGQRLIEELIDNHHYTPGGISIVQQGTPTNNTEEAAAGYTAYNRTEDDLFALEMGAPQFVATTDHHQKKDGQRLAEALGIDPLKIDHLANAGIADVKEAMCMNQALWPTTFGYYMSQLMYPEFTENDILQTKLHFRKFVLGRGTLPCIRIDDQPYGILPVTAYSKLRYNERLPSKRFLSGMLNNVLLKMETTWETLAQQVKHADQSFAPSTTDKAFLEILGLHPSSVEYYQRFATGPYFLWNLYAYNQVIQKKPIGPTVSYATILDFPGLFSQLDYFFTQPPRVFDFVYSVKEKYLDGQVIDPFPFSESRTLNAIGSQGQNYIDWLYAASYNEILREDFSSIGSPGMVPPNSLLYLMLRHACLLEYVRTGISILTNKGLLSADAYLDVELMNITPEKTLSPEIIRLVKTKVERTEFSLMENKIQSDIDVDFIRKAESGQLKDLSFSDVVKAKKQVFEEMRKASIPEIRRRIDIVSDEALKDIRLAVSKTGTLTSKYDFIGTSIDLSSFIYDAIRKPEVDKDLVEMAELRQALDCIRTLPTARLERLFSEHVDLASYRLDAWFSSLAAERLDEIRTTKESAKGSYIGAYSWLENVRPGASPAISYREVEIRPDRILIPGIFDIGLKDIQFPIPIDPLIGRPKPLPIPPRGPVDPRRPVDPRIPPNPRIPQVPPVREHPGDTSKIFERALPMTFLKGDQAEAATIVESGGIRILLDTLKDSLDVRFPKHVDLSALLPSGPGYTYLGTSDPGNAVYDSITDRFISEPRIDPSNQGYIHAPSVNHASTAALLRAGYETHRLNAASPDTAFAVNLSSKRVRRAMQYIEGIRNGQELTALLGYQFERSMHDLDQNLDQYIRDIRLKYPFVAARVTDSTGASEINEAEAYNVVDGLKLMETFRDDPLHWADGITFSPASDIDKVVPVIRDLMDSMDAIHDLLMAESVHQLIQGNTGRGNAAFNAIAGTAVPPIPQVVQTPRGFNALTHRVGIVFDPAPGGHALWTTTGTPRSMAEPRLNRWLAQQLPAKDAIVVRCRYTEAGGVVTDLNITMGDLQIEPIDFLQLMDIDLDGDTNADLYTLISYEIRKTVAQRDDITVQVMHADRQGLEADEYTLAELAPLTDVTMRMVRDGKILDAKDFIPGSEAQPVIAANPGRGLDTTDMMSRLVEASGNTMSNGQPGLGGAITELSQAISALAPNLPSFPGTFDPAQYARLRAAMMYAQLFGITRSVPATATSYQFEVANEMLQVARNVLTDMTTRKSTLDQLLASITSTMTQETKLKILTQATDALFGRGFRLFPSFTLYDAAPLINARSYTHYLDNAGDFALDEWLQGLSPVRKRMHAFHQQALLSSALLSRDPLSSMSIIQFPLAPIDTDGNILTRWLGTRVPAGYSIPPDNLSLVFSYPGSFNPSQSMSGLIIDEWVEEIPLPRVETGIAVHYNNPNSETPNVCLLAVSPDLNGSWSWDDLMDTLNDTLRWAKKRAVDPDLLNKTAYAQLLPAISAAVSGTSDTPTLDFGRNSVTKPRPGLFDLIKLEDYSRFSWKSLNG